MLKIKNRAGCFLAVFAGVLLTSCAPPGPRAVIEGQRLLKQGKYAAAVEKLKVAVSLLRTNALAWNDLALAYHQSGDATNAANAYRKALSLNPDLVEARYNLGCLLLEQNKLDGAKAEFTAYTMRRPKGVEGWLKLGSVQLRLREVSAAEKSFNDALKLSSNNAAALNGQGLAQLQRNRPREAAQAFGAALRCQSNYAPALLNLAVVSQAYLNNRQFALDKYREYALLKPRPADADAVLATVRQLEQELSPAPRPPTSNVATQVTALASVPRPQATTTGAVTVARAPKVEGATDLAKSASMTGAVATLAVAKKDWETVRLPEQPAVKVAQDTSTTAPTPATRPAASSETVVAKAPAARQPETERRGFFQRLNPLNWFRSGSKPWPTPLPSKTVSSPSAPKAFGAAPTSVETVSAGPVTTPAQTSSVSPQEAALLSATQPPKIPRYAYHSPPKPVPGNRREAERAFAQGLQAQRANRLTEAMQAYRQAAQADPSYFEADYNLGVAAQEAKVFPTALSAYESALAINPDSVNARYNFALALRDSGYLLDAVAELEKIVSASPNEARAHLALGNLYALRLRQPAPARQHYLRVLEIEPQHPQATAIRYWLVANPG